MRNCLFFILAALLLVATYRVALAKPEVIRAGIVGCDTSHVIAFTDLINNPQATGALANVEVTVAFPGGSPDMAASRDRLPGFVAQLRERGVSIVNSLDELVDQSDAILLESVDGRVHLDQFRKIAKGKPVFIDKPAAASLSDVIAIFRHAEQTETPVFTSSALRFCDAVQELKNDKSLGEMLGCETAGPLSIDATHPDLFWYGVHGVESLFAIMGRGCESVSRTDSDRSSLVVGKWDDGRIGTYRGLKKGKPNYGFTVYGTEALAQRAGFSGYGPAAEAICEFFTTGEPAVSRDETIEMFAFMEAADESKRQGGEPVAITQILELAEKTAAKD